MKGYEDRILQAGFSHYMTKPVDIDALSKLLAELIGGKKVDAPVEKQATKQTPTQDSTQPALQVAANDQSNDQAISSDESPIYSRLAGSEKLAPVVAKFITRVGDQYKLMESANDKKDFEELAGLAHWLKGSGGTVGFDQLSKPAKELEDHAKAGDQEACRSDLRHIKSIIERLRSGTESEGSQVAKVAAHIPTDAQESSTQAVDKVESSLLAKNPSFLPIVKKFLPRLETQLEAMDKAVDDQDYDELAALAHWLKGSGGTVGFNVFTKPAANMESAAKNNDMELVTKNLADIKDYAGKIVIPGSDDGSTELKKSA